MKEEEILNLWKSYDQKLNHVLDINNTLAQDITRIKVINRLSSMGRIKWIMLFISIPYIILLYTLVFIGFKAGGVFFTLGFGIIALIMSIITGVYIYHLYLIGQIDKSDEVIDVQRSLAKLRISSFNVARLAIFQIPFWSLCWISMDALKNSIIIYGTTNILIFSILCYFSYWLYQNMNLNNSNSKVNKFFFSGPEWDPIIRSYDLISQLEEYDVKHSES